MNKAFQNKLNKLWEWREGRLYRILSLSLTFVASIILLNGYPWEKYFKIWRVKSFTILVVYADAFFLTAWLEMLTNSKKRTAKNILFFSALLLACAFATWSALRYGE